MVGSLNRRASHRGLLFAAFSATLALVQPLIARAEPTKEDVKRADILFRDAQILVQKGRLAEGCPKFAESQRLDPGNGTLLNLALCHEKEGKTATAYRELQELLAIVSASKSPDDRERARVAMQRLKVLEKKLPRVTFDVSALPKDAKLTLDDETVNDPAFPVLVDPGSHELEVTASGKKPGHKTFDVKEPGPQTVTLEALADEPPPPPPPPPPEPPPPPPKSAPAPDTAAGQNQRILGGAVAGAGLLGVGLGIVFGLDTFAKKSDRDAHCSGTVCDAEGMRLHDQAGTSATISSVAFLAGALAIGAGAYLFFTAPAGKSAASNRAASAMPLRFGPSGIALGL